MAADIHIITRANISLLDTVAPDVFDQAVQPNWLAAFCAQPNHFMAVAERKHLVVGQIRAMLHYNPDEPPILYIDNLGVAPTQKRKGIATALFEAALDWGRAQGMGSYWVATELDNDEGNRFYESLSLKGVQMLYYEDDLT